MSQKPIAAACEIADAHPDDITSHEVCFFTASTSKLVIMSICTFGLYEMHWFYKNWQLIKKSGKRCNPALRALFAPLFALSCFRYISDSKIKHNINMKFPVALLSLAYFMIHATWRLPFPYSLISILSFLPMIAANRTALAVNKTQFPNFTNNRNFTKWNLLAIVVGGMLLAMVIFGGILLGSDAPPTDSGIPTASYYSF